MISHFATNIIQLVLPKATEHIAKIFKLEKVLKYVEEENETDAKVVKLEQQVQLLATELGKTQDRLKKIEILNGK